MSGGRAVRCGGEAAGTASRSTAEETHGCGRNREPPTDSPPQLPHLQKQPSVSIDHTDHTNHTDHIGPIDDTSDGLAGM